MEQKVRTEILHTTPLGDISDVAKIAHLLKHLHSQQP